MLQLINHNDSDQKKIEKMNAVILAMTFDNPQNYIDNKIEKYLVSVDLKLSEFKEKAEDIEKIIIEKLEDAEYLLNNKTKNLIENIEEYKFEISKEIIKLKELL